MRSSVSDQVLRPRPEVELLSDFGALYETYVDVLWRVVARLGVSDSAVEDVVQEVFVVAYRRRAQFEARSSLRTWLTGIAIRIASNWRRNTLRSSNLAPLTNDLVDGVKTPESLSETQSELELVQRTLNALTDERREVFVLAELEELTAPEIAAATGTNVNTVYSRLRLARQDIEAALRRAKENP